MKNKDKPCQHCGDNKWKTLKKGLKWMCRNCTNLREVKE